MAKIMSGHAVQVASATIDKHVASTTTDKYAPSTQTALYKKPSASDQAAKPAPVRTASTNGFALASLDSKPADKAVADQPDTNRADNALLAWAQRQLAQVVQLAKDSRCDDAAMVRGPPLQARGRQQWQCSPLGSTFYKDDGTYLGSSRLTATPQKSISRVAAVHVYVE